MIKQCSKCSILKEIDLFPKNKVYKDNYSTWCKECHKNAVIKSYYKNREKELEYARLYRKRDEVKERTKLYNKEYQKENRDILNKKRRVYCMNNKELIAAIDRKHQRRRWIVKKDTNLDVNFLLKLKSKTTHCEICNIKLTNKNTDLDHIVPLNIGGAHSNSNVRYICSSCNRGRPSNGKDLIGNYNLKLAI